MNVCVNINIIVLHYYANKFLLVFTVKCTSLFEIFSMHSNNFLETVDNTFS